MQVEAEVLQPMWFEGEQIAPEEGKPAPIIALGKSDAVYLQSIGRVRIIVAEPEAKPANAKNAKKAKAE